MKNFRRNLALVIACLFVASAAGACGGGACADLEKKKADCKGDKDTCEKPIDAAVKAGNQDACKAVLDSMNKTK
jgi:hypothetical protein